jgi:hypothetical protein
MFEQFEDRIRLKPYANMAEFISPYQDFRKHASSVNPEIALGINIIKPERPGPILIQLHGWHMSMPEPVRRDIPLESNRYVIIQVDMRGRAFSAGYPDCNGYELIDIYDALQFVRQEYKPWIADPELVYLEGGSGGGGNVLATVGKFPDLYAAASAYYGISDYAMWYEEDQTGEFRDEMDVWIGCSPMKDPQRYQARSGYKLAPNLITPLYIAHGDQDVRVPVTQTRKYIESLKACGKQNLLQCDILCGVGGPGHQDHMTEEQREMMLRRSEHNRMQHAAPLNILGQGTFVVGGYLYTKLFKVRLECPDQLAVLEYDLSQSVFQLTASRPYSYTIEMISGEMIYGVCTPHSGLSYRP